MQFFNVPFQRGTPPHAGHGTYGPCPSCAQVRMFSTATSYNRHIRQHKGIFPYHCRICKKGFTSNTSLLEHLSTHDGVKRIQCEICNELFATRYLWKRHVATEHPGLTDCRPKLVDMDE